MTQTSLPSFSVEFPLDPAKLSTAQQKKISFHSRRIFTNKRVVAAMQAIEFFARQHSGRMATIVPYGTPARLTVRFFYAYPKGTAKSRLVENAPMPSGADLDNRYKAFGDALVRAGWFLDDRYITSLTLEKRRTIAAPRILVSVSPDR